MEHDCPICLESLRPLHFPLSSSQLVYPLAEFRCKHALHKSCFQSFVVKSLPQQKAGELVLKCPFCRAVVDSYCAVEATHDSRRSSSFFTLAHFVHSLLPTNLQSSSSPPPSPEPPVLEDLPSSSSDEEEPTERDLQEGLDLEEPFVRPQTISVQTNTERAFTVSARAPFRAPRRTARRGRLPYFRDPDRDPHFHHFNPDYYRYE